MLPGQLQSKKENVCSILFDNEGHFRINAILSNLALLDNCLDALNINMPDLSDRLGCISHGRLNGALKNCPLRRGPQ